MFKIGLSWYGFWPLSLEEDISALRANFEQSNGSGMLSRAIFKIGDLVGKGSFAEVRQCTIPGSNQSMVAKVLKKNHFADLQPNNDATRSPKCMFLTEIQCLSNIKHPNIVKLIDSYEDQNSYYSVMEACTGGQLFSLVTSNQKITIQQLADILSQVIQAIAAVHALGIAHRDIKAENFIYKDNKRESLKLIDFGFAIECSGPYDLSVLCGSPHYLAPEIMTCGRYGMPVDLWSAGVLAFLLMAKQYPFDGDTPYEICRLAATSEPDWSLIRDWPEEARDLVKKLLVRDPHERYTALEARAHPFILNRLVEKKRQQERRERNRRNLGEDLVAVSEPLSRMTSDVEVPGSVPDEGYTFLRGGSADAVAADAASVDAASVDATLLLLSGGYYYCEEEEEGRSSCGSISSSVSSLTRLALVQYSEMCCCDDERVNIHEMRCPPIQPVLCYNYNNYYYPKKQHCACQMCITATSTTTSTPHPLQSHSFY